MKKVLAILAVLLMWSIPAVIEATADTDVTIEAGELVHSESGLTTDVMVHFDDLALYHEQVYLSYHIYDENGAVLVFENQRIPFAPEEDGRACVTVNVNHNSGQPAQIRFDLVDERNAFWFSTNTEIAFQTEVVHLGREQQGQASSATATVIAGVICVAGVATFIFVALKRKRKTGGDNLTVPGKRLDFLDLLRAFACLCVVYSHYAGYLLGNLNGYFSQLLDCQQERPRFLLLRVIEDPSGLGVSIFFLITGFLTAHSLEKDSKASFLLRRLLRIYPVYIAGLAIMWVTSILYTRWAGTTLPWGISEWLASASLLRDWLHIPSVDALGWTLEVQLKMYVGYFLLKRWRILDNCFRMILLMAGAAAFNMIMGPYMKIDSVLQPILYVVIFSVVFLLFGLLGVVLHNYHCGKWNMRESAAVCVVCFLCFRLALTHSEVVGVGHLPAYTTGAVIFVLAFLMREHVRVGWIMSFLAKISFSVYVLHAINGYYLLSIFDRYGVHPYLSMAAVITLCIIISYVFYRLVEAPLLTRIRKLKSF